MKTVMIALVALLVGIGAAGIMLRLAHDASVQVTMEGDLYYLMTVREHLDAGNVQHAAFLLGHKADCLRTYLEERRRRWTWQTSDFGVLQMQRAARFEGDCRRASAWTGTAEGTNPPAVGGSRNET